MCVLRDLLCLSNNLISSIHQSIVRAPRSPRATIMASDSARIDWKFSRPADTQRKESKSAAHRSRHFNTRRSGLWPVVHIQTCTHGKTNRPSWFSILEMILICRPLSPSTFLISFTSLALRTKLSEGGGQTIGRKRRQSRNGGEWQGDCIHPQTYADSRLSIKRHTRAYVQERTWLR